MARISLNQTQLAVALVVLSLFLASCTSSANSRYFGLTQPPKDNVLRYVTGSEPESLDPQIGTGQPEARIYMALYDGLVEYHPKTMEPIPAIAESWEIGTDGTEYLFHLRKNAKFSDGEPITAKDFVYTFRRGLSPELASRNGYLAYYIKYAEAYNSDQSFVKDANGQFLLKKDFAEPDPNQTAETAAPQQHDTLGGDSEFHRYLDSPERLYVPTDEKERAKVFEKNAKLKAAVEGKELAAVKAEDIGIEAVDDYTLRVKLYQPAPFFLGLLAHQFFRVLPQKTIEKFKSDWSEPENIVTSGAFKVSVYKPYDELVVVKDPNYWDAANVKLAGIEFYPLDEQTTMMNLYKAGRVDALYNHTVPGPWNESIRQYKDEYLLHPEVATEFYVINVKKPPMDNLKVRQAFALAIDRVALAEFRRTIKPLNDLTPEGIFPKYEEARKKVYAEKLKENNISQEEWAKRTFDPEKARKLMTEAGFPVQKSGSGYATPTFPVDKVNITYNTAEANKAVAEFVQAQWKQNLGITVPLKNLEFKTYLPLLSKVEYDGFGRRGWVGDYMDPFTFLGLFYTQVNEGATGWWDPKYDKMMNEANNTVDPQKRFEKLAEAEFYVSQQQIIIPLSTAGTSWMKKPFVKGFYPNPGTLHAWKFVYIEQDANKWDSNVDNIMTASDSAVEQQLGQLTAKQEQMEKSKSVEADKANTAKAE
ncbi:MAG TPA: peptide ABC transporter substrate-binding protein [Pyrinomonadaceae bacterium]|nr:peptide ABC transporter substrate-binding protein [Pyrinomonadaceae bacterium]